MKSLYGNVQVMPYNIQLEHHLHIQVNFNMLLRYMLGKTLFATLGNNTSSMELQGVRTLA